MTDVHFDPDATTVGSGADDGFAIGVVALVDLMLIVLWWAGETGAPEAVGVHSLATAGAVLTLIVYRTEQTVRALGTGALLILFGPLGGPTLASARFLARRLGRIEALSDAAAETVAADRSACDRIHQQIVQGRRYAPASGRPDRFKAVLAGMDSGAQHSAISTITRNYSPKMRPALDMALRSPNAALRVQAAAVFAKLRTSYSDRATEVLLELRENPRGEGIADLAREARGVAHSGFVEDDLKRHLLAVAELLDSRASGKAGDVTSDPPDGDPTRPFPTPMMRYSCGGLAR